MSIIRGAIQGIDCPEVFAFCISQLPGFFCQDLMVGKMAIDDRKNCSFGGFICFGYEVAWASRRGSRQSGRT